MVCLTTGKQIFSRKRVKRVLRHHCRATCDRCRSGWYAWNQYVCDSCHRRHVGHRWIGGLG